MSIPIPSPVPIGPLKDRISTLEAEAISVLDFGAKGDGATDDTLSLQAALDRAMELGGARVVVPPGTYLISEYLQIGSRTHLHLDDAATIRRVSDANAMVVNRSDGSGGYDAAHGIRISGGTWDANATEHPTPCTAIGIGHASDVLIEGVTIKDIYSWHHIELNAVQRGQIVGCKFTDFVIGSRVSEAVQLDLAVSEAAWPWFGPWDNTPCRDIIIERCHFSGQSRGIGTHSSADGVQQERILIHGCHFEDCDREAIRGEGWADVTVSGCSIHDCGRGLYATSGESSSARWVVSGNTFHGIGKGSTASEVRAIYFQGSSTDSRNVSHITVHGNTVLGSGRHGITFDYCQDIVVAANVLRDIGVSAGGSSGFGVAVWNSDRAVISGNRVDETRNSCVRVDMVSADVVIEGNCFTPVYETAAGVRIDPGSVRVVVKDNVIRGGAIGIRLEGRDCIVSGNAISETSEQGISMPPAAATNLVTGNSIRTDLAYGIRVYEGAEANIIAHNDLRGAGTTPLRDDSDTSVVEGNWE